MSHNTIRAAELRERVLLPTKPYGLPQRSRSGPEPGAHARQQASPPV